MVIWYAAQIKYQGKYIDDEKNGIGKEFQYDDKNQPNVIFEGIYKNGKKWDVIDEKSLSEIISKNQKENCSNISKIIINESLKRGTKDNVSCIVAKFN